MAGRKKDTRKADATRIAQETTKKFGYRTAHTAAQLANVEFGVIPSGILALDYMTGLGGYPEGFPVEVFGAPDIGKSSAIGLSYIREAQNVGKLCGLIAVEPSFDEAWAVKHGIDPELLIVAYPDNGEDAFAILWDWVEAGVPDAILFDSIGAVKPSGKAAEEGKTKAFGASGLISAGITNVAPLIFKKDISLLLLNQQRDDTNAKIPGLVKPPGGWALKHLCPLRIQLKSAKDRYYTKMKTADETNNVLIGRRLIASIVRNKLAENSAPGRKAQFDFYHMEVKGQPFGVDVGKDVVDTGITSGVIDKTGGWYHHATFPGSKHKINGVEAVREFIAKTPDALPKIRNDILAAMLGDNVIQRPSLEAVKED